QRHAVILGGGLMAAGHLLMAVESSTPFFIALGLLVVGNGFFKPNISTMVGSLYPPGSERRDAGFTLFYMGINLGAAMSPLICAYIGETYGWHYGFNLATLGMIIGLLVFIAPPAVNMVTISVGALTASGTLIYIAAPGLFRLINGLIAVAMVVAAAIAVMALQRGGLPDWTGRQPESAKAMGVAAWGPVYAGTIVAVPVLAFLINRNEIAERVLYGFGLIALAWLLYQIATRPKVERERLQVVLVLMFFSLLFWAFFEQAGSSLTNFTDRNVDRVEEERVLAADEVGSELTLDLNQGQLGYKISGFDVLTINELDGVRAGGAGKPGYYSVKITQADVGKSVTRSIKGQDDVENTITAEDVDKVVDLRINDQLMQFELPDIGKPDQEFVDALEEGKVEIEITQEHVGMPIGGNETPASIFQSLNPTFILIFGLVFSTLWTFLASKNLEPSIPVKFSLGLAQLGLGFGAFYIGAQQSSEQGMVWMGWLILGYLLHTTGELCISPVGLSMVTKLSPADIVSTVMGAWFLALAFSNFLAGKLAGLTGVSHGGEGADAGAIPPPLETLPVYSEVFLKICIASLIGAVICFILSFFLTNWMHKDEPTA
ncbi:MAG: peptide MFS transporter, partial [Candidatus Eremiobacteraeota bacterium]|nr:peptide MFS transporter [Candidatus Eremiobacteraeota bacterium]